MRSDEDATSVEPGSKYAPIMRGARLLATPASIVVAWIVVVTQWNSSDEALFNWATVTAAIVLAIVTVAWLVSMRFPALRRALLPFEGGLVVGAIVLAGATSGREVDMLGDRIAIAIAFGVIAALLLAFMQQLVAGRRRAPAWLVGTIVACAIAGIVVPATLDWLDGDLYPTNPYMGEASGELLARAADDGFQLGDVALMYAVAPLSDGFLDDALVASASAFAEPAMAYAAPAEAAVADPASAPAAAPIPEPELRSNWARLLAQPDGSIRLAVSPAIARGAGDVVRASVRRGTCGNAPGAAELLAFDIAASPGPDDARTLPLTVSDLQLDDQISIVVGVPRPLAPTRCMQLLTGSGVALAQLGAPGFLTTCVAPLQLPPDGMYQVRASSFQDASCARRFEEYVDVAGSLLVDPAKIAAYRDCHRTHEQQIETTERLLPTGVLAVRYTSDMIGDCLMHGVNGSTYGAFGFTGIASAPMPVPGSIEASPEIP